LDDTRAVSVLDGDFNTARGVDIEDRELSDIAVNAGTGRAYYWRSGCCGDLRVGTSRGDNPTIVIYITGLNVNRDNRRSDNLKNVGCAS
jgi:hypothetical protein